MDDLTFWMIRCRYSHGNLVESEIFEPSLHQEQQLNVQRQSRAALAVALLARRVASSILGVAIDGPQVMGGTEPEPAPDHVIASPDALAKAIYILTGPLFLFLLLRQHTHSHKHKYLYTYTYTYTISFLLGLSHPVCSCSRRFRIGDENADGAKEV
jgi:hypothetical protein